MAVSEAARRPPKAAMLVAQRIVQDALRKGLGAGDLLEPERTMLEKYQTGRGTLREALRLLEFQGVISLKPGPRGGPVLQNPDAAHLGSTLVLLMQLRSAPFRNIVEVRSAVEPMISSLAATRMTEEELGELRGTVDQMREEIDDQYSFLDANKRFHDIIAWSSGNALFGYVIESLLGIMDGTVIGIDYPGYRRSAILKAHVEIYDALESRDPEASEARMREHIQAYERYAERKFPQLMNETIPWDQRYFG
jgi:GntR family transcriptional regulator, transcriptional repressor for pyruvate dehydrogenase complex